MVNENYHIIIEKLDGFIRKYYKNLLIKGLLISIAFLITYFLVLGILEHFSYFNTSIRTILFYSYILFTSLTILYFIIIPLLKLFKLGKVITYSQCSDLISIHFPEVKDKLINIIELNNNLTESEINKDLILASINQKANNIKLINFSRAIDISKNRKYIKYLSAPAVVLLMILFTSPSLITESANRILYYQTVFEKPNPFTFEILNNKLEVVQQEDYQLNIKIIGEKLPANAFIKIGSSIFPLVKQSKILYSYLFKQINAPITFQLLAEDYQTKSYTIEVLKKPLIVNFDVLLTYPKYTGKKEEKLTNIGDLNIPEGTKLTWNFKTLNTSKLLISFNTLPVKIENSYNGNFIFSNNFYKSSQYTIKASNELISAKDSIIYSINIIQDQYPQIEVFEYNDSIYKYSYFFTGNIKDDYGFSNLTFNYKLLNQNDSLKNAEIIKIPINCNNTQSQFNYFIDFASLNINPGEKIEYYFEIFDNDGINGSKSTKSKVNTIEIPTLEQINKITDNKNEDIKDLLKDKISELNNLQSKLEKFNKKVLEKEKLTWQEKKELSDILEQEQKIKNDIENIKKENIEKNTFENEFNKPDQELLEKQNKLQELFDEVLNEETKKLFEELQKLMENVDKNKIQEIIDKMKMSNQDLKDQLDRNLELFKQLEFENKLDNIINQIDELKQKQDSLAKQTNKSSNENLPNLIKEQEKIQKKFENITNDLNKLDTLNKNLENPKELSNTDKKEEEIKSDMNKSSNDLKNNNKKNASKSQKDATEKLEELQNELSEMKEKEEQEQNEEDISSLRQILENLIQVSFNQEELIFITKKINVTDPKYIKLIQNQKKIGDDLQIIEDSLFALSKRQIQIEPIVNKEINKINNCEKKSINFLNERNISSVLINQQLAMTSVNNLALLLSEALNQMKEQNNKNKNSGKKGSTCKKPGSGKPDMESIRKLQQQLNKEIQDLKEDNMPKPGDKGNNTMSEKLAKLAAQQQILRNQLKQVQEQIQKESGGSDSKQIKKISDMMEETETDLVNKIISKQLMERQKEIETRLLESEKSEKQKDFDKKRESNEAKNLYLSNKILKIEYNNYKTNERELLKKNNPLYNNFYKNKINEYFNNFNQ